MTDLAVQSAGIAMLSETDARILTLSIRRGIDELDAALRAAVVGRVHLALGYETLTDWWVNEVGSARLSGEVRDMWIRQIKDDRPDMDQRAIGSAVGASQSTVHRVLSPRDSNESTQTPEPAATPQVTPVAGSGTSASPSTQDPRVGGESPAGFAAGGAGEAVASPREGGAATAAPADAERAAALVAAALDKFVPDPDGPKRAWRKRLYDRLDPVHDFLLWLKAEDVAQFADEQDVTTLRHLATSFADAHRRAVEATTATVTPLRRVK